MLALRGHRVSVVERNGEAGGQLGLARLVPQREELAGLVTYLVGALARAGGALRLGVEATAETVMAEAPDLVVVATGARIGVPPIPGILDSPAVDPFEVLRRPVSRLRRALVIGGGMIGVGIAHALGARGLEVVLAEPSEVLAGELGLRPRWQYVANLPARPNVTVHRGTSVEALSGATARLRHGEEEWEIGDLDLVVPAWPRVATAGVRDALASTPGGPAVFDIGDCVVPHTAFEAMQEGAALGHRL